MPIENTFEVFIEIFHGNRAQFMKHSSNLHTVIGVWITAQVSGHEDAIGEGAVEPELRGIVMTISQHKADLGGDFA